MLAVCRIALLGWSLLAIIYQISYLCNEEKKETPATPLRLMRATPDERAVLRGSGAHTSMSLFPARFFLVLLLFGDISTHTTKGGKTALLFLQS